MFELSLFSGIGGGLLGTKHILGWRTIGYVEKDKLCQKIIRLRIKDGFLDDAPMWSDISTFDGKQFKGLVDIITAGFPCQPFSLAGKRAAADDKNNTWPDTIRTICEVEPTFCLLENVTGLISSGYFGIILGDLYKAGFNAKWVCLSSAAEIQAPHERERLWLMAHSIEIRWERWTWLISNPARGKKFQNSIFRNFRHKSNRPRMGRELHGIPYRMDRIGALGNSQIPGMAAKAWYELINESGSCIN